ncbi:MAG: septum formation family protein, partial [Pseudonocardia sp.]
MMTVAMDRTLTAPAPPDARSPGFPASDGPHSGRASRTPDPLGGPVRRLAAGIAIGAAAMLGVAVLDSVADTTVPVLGSFAALPERAGGPAFVEVPPPPATPGTCLNWTRGDAADAEVVECARPHLFEQAGSVSLTDQTVLPDERGFRQLVTERCTPVVVTYLSGRFDPDGRFRVGALKPSAAKWAEGDRELRCGLQSSSRSGAMFTTTGKVADSDQAAVQEPGSCLGIDGRTIGDPVSCALPHAVETVGVVDLGPKFPDGYPKVEDQDAFLQPECARIAGEYAGDPNAIAAKKLTVYWDNLGEESWKVGTR